ncbi:MAG TPA: hypothetical protein VF798_01855 [Burkholderiaceae bacterium]
MFFLRHPKPVGNQKAVATQVVQRRRQSGAMDTRTIIVDTPRPELPPQRSEAPEKE